MGRVQSQLGTISYHGLGVPLEWVKAARLYAAASERGDTIGSVW
jgi:TPR repeat protein